MASHLPDKADASLRQDFESFFDLRSTFSVSDGMLAQCATLRGRCMSDAGLCGPAKRKTRTFLPHFARPNPRFVAEILRIIIRLAPNLPADLSLTKLASPYRGPLAAQMGGPVFPLRPHAKGSPGNR